MAVDASLSLFSKYLQTSFRIGRGGLPAVELELIEARALPYGRPGGSREPFSLIFRGVGSTCLAQGTYRLEHDACEPLEIFLVPIGPGGDPPGPQYQAIFN